MGSKSPRYLNHFQRGVKVSDGGHNLVPYKNIVETDKAREVVVLHDFVSHVVEEYSLSPSYTRSKSSSGQLGVRIA
jgi:hypothetical protein